MSVLRTALKIPSEQRLRDFLTLRLSECLVDGCVVPLQSLSVDELLPVARRLMGVSWIADASENLRRHVAVEFQYPHFRKFTCGQCRAWWIDPTDGTMARSHGRSGEALRRDPNDPPLCEVEGETCPRGHWSYQQIDEMNREALQHFLDCDASSHFPDDAIVSHNARIIRNALRGIKGSHPVATR